MTYANLIFTVTDAQGKVCAGYTVTVDETSLKTNDSGRVTFPDVTMEPHHLTITAPGGVGSRASLSFSPSPITGMITGNLGGSYEIGVRAEAGQVFLNLQFNGGGALSVSSASEEEVKPEVVETHEPGTKPEYGNGRFRIVAQFFESDGKKAYGRLGVQLNQEGGAPTQSLTNSSGMFEFANGSFGRFQLATATSEAQLADPFVCQLDISKGNATALSNSAGNNYEISTTMRAKELYFKFVQDGDGFRLVEVSEDVPGSINTMVLGVIVFAAIVVGIILLIVLLRKKFKKNAPPKPAKRAPQAEDPLMRQRKAPPRAPLQENDNASVVTRKPTPPRKPAGSRQTGGSNKFDDRNRF